MARGDKLQSSVEELLQADEKVRAVVMGSATVIAMGKSMKVSGIIVATDLRVGFFGKWLGGSSFTAIRYESISSVTSSKNGLTGLSTVEVTSANESVKVGSLNSDQCSDLLLIVDEMRLSKSTPGPSAGSTGSSSLLLELADLRDRGIISSEEFEKKKQEILDRM